MDKLLSAWVSASSEGERRRLEAHAHRFTPDDVRSALALRVVAHSRWRWAPGMLLTGGYRLVEADVAHGHIDGTPDLTDWATTGAILGMLPLSQATDDGAWPHGSHWRVRCEGMLYAGSTMGEAAARAFMGSAK